MITKFQSIDHRSRGGPSCGGREGWRIKYGEGQAKLKPFENEHNKSFLKYTHNKGGGSKWNNQLMEETEPQLAIAHHQIKLPVMALD